MKWFCGLETIVDENVCLGPRTWYGIGGPARYLCEPQSVDQVCDVVRRSRMHGIPLKVLGGGANVLVRDRGFDGIVLQLPREHFGQVLFDGRTVRAGGAVDLPALARRCASAGLAGLEGLAGIPGTIGGATRMNAGGRFGEIGDSVCAARVVDHRGNLELRDRARLDFGYRRSNLADVVIIDVVLSLKAGDPRILTDRYRQLWDVKKNSQPLQRNNAGCVFKNPAGASAGELIDRAGLKGLSCGGASVSVRHANFIVTEPGTTAEHILALVRQIQDRVHEQFNIVLELEVDVW